MRIAILFFGRLKTFEDCYESIKCNFLDLFKDSTYDSFLSHNSNNISDNIELFNELYNVKDYESINVNECVNLSEYDYIPLHHWKYSSKKAIYFCHNLKRAYQIMENYALVNSIKYDIIIMMRGDMIINKPYIIPDTILENTIYTPIVEKHTGINGQFAFGTPESMKLFCNINDNIKEIYKNYNEGYHIETYIGYNIIFNKLNMIDIDINYILHPARHN
jgi:hypothetical protein